MGNNKLLFVAGLACVCIAARVALAAGLNPTGWAFFITIFGPYVGGLMCAWSDY